jgi:Ca2+-binding RTX toxin-like protein
MADFPTAGDDNITGTSGPDTIDALAGNDTVDGGGDNDTLNGGADNDTLYGGDGNDTLDGGAGMDTIDGEEGNDILTATGGSGDWLFGGLGDDSLTAAFGSFNMFGDEGGSGAQDGNDTLTLTNGGTASWLNGGGGNDVINASGIGQIIVDGGGGNDQITIAGYSNGTVSNGGGDDLITLPTGYFTINLSGGRNTIDLTTIAPGFMTITGFNAGEAGDVLDLSIYGADPFGDGTLVWGGNSADTYIDHVPTTTRYVLQGVARQNLSAYNLGVPNPFYAPQNMVLNDAFADNPTIQYPGELVGADGNDTISGYGGDDRLFGGGGDDHLLGGNDADYLSGGSGNDFLEGFQGADTMIGGTGNDTFFAATGDTVVELAGEGTDTVMSPLGSSAAPYVLPDFVENFIGTSAGAQGVRGNGLDNIFTMGAGNDLVLADSGGVDTVNGGVGNDLLYFGAAFTGADTVDGGEGADSVVLQGNYTLTLSPTNITNVESISLQSGARTTWGDTANNFYDYSVTTVDGNVAAGQQLIVNGQSLRVGEDFTFNGSAEIDGKFQLFGGYGVDTLTGGAGNDVFVFSDGRWGASDVVNGGGGRDALVITAGPGLTHIEFGANALINMESVSVSTVYTATRDATPSYEFVLHDGNTAAGQTLIVNGSSLLNSLQSFSVDGSAELDGQLILFGGAGTDVLIGGAQADQIYGGSNADTLTGGGGADTFRYDAVTDSTAAARDHILDFLSGTDKFDLSRIDANNGAAGNQAFSWIGSNAFAGTGAASAGELRAYESGGSWYVEGDVNGDGTADLVIQVDTAGNAPLVVGDFIL